MISIQNIKDNFSHINSWTGYSEGYHDTIKFEGQGTLCDLYFISDRKEVKQEQVETYNYFESNYRNYIEEIERYISSSFKYFESTKPKASANTLLFFDVIEIPIDNLKYDLVLVCGKTYKQFFLFKKSVMFRVEFKNGRIKTIQRKKDTTKEND